MKGVSTCHMLEIACAVSATALARNDAGSGEYLSEANQGPIGRPKRTFACRCCLHLHQIRSL